eukprot:SAG11_NODE_70_length_18450_cov_14.704975_11_plen_67_part_00
MKAGIGESSIECGTQEVSLVLKSTLAVGNGSGDWCNPLNREPLHCRCVVCVTGVLASLYSGAVTIS